MHSIYNIQDQQTQFAATAATHVRQSGGEGYTRKATLLLPIAIQLTTPVLFEGVGEGVGGCRC